MGFFKGLWGVLEVVSDVAYKTMDELKNEESITVDDNNTPRMNSIIAIGEGACNEDNAYFQMQMADDIYNLCDDATPEEINVAITQLSKIASNCDNSYFRRQILSHVEELGRY